MGRRSCLLDNWQRLAIARMLYRNREVFIMDEPFTFIDTQSKE
jgi:ABC-type Mn2+/Zn2+ transport system ATPase subunit